MTDTNPSPLDVWQKIQPESTIMWKAVQTNLENMYNSLLLDPMLETPNSFVGNKSSLYSFFKGGNFAVPSPLAQFDKVSILVYLENTP